MTIPQIEEEIEKIKEEAKRQAHNLLEYQRNLENLRKQLGVERPPEVAEDSSSVLNQRIKDRTY